MCRIEPRTLSAKDTEMATGKFISPFMSGTMDQQLDDGNALQFTLPEASLFEDSLGDNFHSKALDHGDGDATKLLENASSRVNLDDSLCGDIDEAETQLQVDQLDIDTVPPKAEDNGPSLDDSLCGDIDEAETQLQMDQSDVNAAPPIVVNKGPGLDDSLCGDDDEAETQLQVEQVSLTHPEPPRVNYGGIEVADGSKVAERAPSLDDSLCGDPEETQANEADVQAPGVGVPSMNDSLCCDDNADETQLPVDHVVPQLLEDEDVTSKVTHTPVASPAMNDISGVSSTTSELTEALSGPGEKESGTPQNASTAAEQIPDKKTNISTDGDKCEEKMNEGSKSDSLQHFSQSSSPVNSEASLPAANKGSESTNNTTPKSAESSHSKVVPSFGKKKKGFVLPAAIASTPANSENKQSTSTIEAKTAESPSADGKSKPGGTEEKQAGECGAKEKVVSPQTDKEKPETDKENSSSQGAQKPKFSPPAPKPTSVTKAPIPATKDTTNNAKSSLQSEKGPAKPQKKDEQVKKKGAKKQENDQVRDQKKQEKEQKQVEKEQKKAEKERLKEEKRLEQERKKAEREQKKMEKELKKMEREQKKAQKQPTKVKVNPQKGDTEAAGDGSSNSKADKTAAEAEASLQETAQSEVEGSHSVPPSEPNCSATNTVTDGTTDSSSTENVDDSAMVQDGQEGDPAESETNENGTTATNDASDQPLTGEKASNVAEEDAVQAKESDCGSPPIEQPQPDEKETDSNLDSNDCTIEKQSSHEKSGDNTDLEASADSKHSEKSNAEQSNTNTEKSNAEQSNINTEKSNAEQSNTNTEKSNAEPSNTNTEKSCAEPRNTSLSTKLEKDPATDEKKERNQKKKAQKKDDKTPGTITAKKTKPYQESKKNTTKNGAQTSKGNKSQGTKTTGKTLTGKKEKHPNPPSRSRKRKATSDSGSSTTEESDSAPEPKKQRSKPTNYSGPVWVQCEKCQKWRQLRDCLDPSKLPEQWECSMNTDTAYNSCSAPEEQWSDLGDSQEFVESPFIPGSIIWAKMDGYPWWPAMVEEDPDEEAYYEMGRGGSNVPARYHVVFFDRPVCRAWVSTLHTQTFAGECDINESLSIPQKYKRALKENVKQAQRALNMPIVERLAQFTFSKRYRKNTSNRKRKHSDDVGDDECTHTAYGRSSSAKSGNRKSARLSSGAIGEENGQEKENANVSHCDGGGDRDRDPEEMASGLEADQEAESDTY